MRRRCCLTSSISAHIDLFHRVSLHKSENIYANVNTFSPWRIYPNPTRPQRVFLPADVLTQEVAAWCVRLYRCKCVHTKRSRGNLDLSGILAATTTASDRESLSPPSLSVCPSAADGELQEAAVCCLGSSVSDAGSDRRSLLISSALFLWLLFFFFWDAALPELHAINMH